MSVLGDLNKQARSGGSLANLNAEITERSVKSEPTPAAVTTPTPIPKKTTSGDVKKSLTSDWIGSEYIEQGGLKNTAKGVGLNALQVLSAPLDTILNGYVNIHRKARGLEPQEFKPLYGWNEYESDLRDVVDPTGKTNYERLAEINPILANTYSMGMEILVDPTTYIGAGGLKAGYKAVSGAAAREAVRTGETAARNLGKVKNIPRAVTLDTQTAEKLRERPIEPINLSTDVIPRRAENTAEIAENAVEAIENTARNTDLTKPDIMQDLLMNADLTPDEVNNIERANRAGQPFNVSPERYDQLMREIGREVDNAPIANTATTDRAVRQFEIIQKNNPMTDDIHTGIRAVDEIRSFDDVTAPNEFVGTPDYTQSMADSARESGAIRVYSSEPIEDGGFVTPSRMMAEDYAGGGKVYEREIPIDDVAWIDSTEGQYAPIGESRTAADSVPTPRITDNLPAEAPRTIPTRQYNPTRRPLKQKATVTPDEAAAILKDEEPTGIRKAWRNFYRRFVSGQEPIERLAKVAGDDTLAGYTQAARTLKGTMEYLFRNGLRGLDGRELNPKSFLEVMRVEQKNVKDLNDLAISLHNIDRIKEGKQIYKSARTQAVRDAIDTLHKQVDDAVDTLKRDKRETVRQLRRDGKDYQGVAEQYDARIKQIQDDALEQERELLTKEARDTANEIIARNPQVYEELKAMQNWDNQMAEEYLVGSGLLSREQWEAMRNTYANYVPTYREGKGAMGGGSVGKNTSPGKTIHAAKGFSDREVMNIQDGYLRRLENIVRAAKRNQLYLSIIDAIEKDPQRFRSFGVEISKEGKKIRDAIELDDMLLEPSGLQQVKDGSFLLTAYRDGQKVTYTIPGEMAEALELLESAVGKGWQTDLAEWGKMLTNPLKAGITGYNPLFAVANISRDMPTYFIQSVNNPRKAISGLGKALQGMTGKGKNADFYADLYERYKALGGKQAGYYNQGKGFERNMKTHLTKAGAAWDTVKGIMSFLGETGESLPRFAEFINGVEKYGANEDGMLRALSEAADVTVNFGRSAPVTKMLDAYVLYLNAAVQGIDKFARTVKAHPIKTLGKSAAAITAPYVTLTAYNWDNPHYQDLPDRIKQNYFCIPNLKGEVDENGYAKTFIKIPLNREYGAIMGSSMDVLFGLMEGEEDPFKGYSSSLATNFLPSNPIDDNVFAPATLNLKYNQDFAGRKIIPTAYEDKPAAEQYDYSTSGVAKGIANVANRIPINSALDSPMKVDYLIDSYGGYFGGVAQGATAPAGKIPERVENTFVDPFKQRFTADPRYSSGVTNDVYERLAEATTAKNSANATPEDKARYKALNKVAKELSESYKAEREVMENDTLTKKQKQEEVKRIREERNEIARSATERENEAVAEAQEAPTFSALETDTKDKYKEGLGVDKEEWATLYNNKSKSDSSITQALSLVEGKSNMGLSLAQSFNSNIRENNLAEAKRLYNAGISSSVFEGIRTQLRGKNSGDIKTALDSMPYSRNQRAALYAALTNTKSNPYE